MAAHDDENVVTMMDVLQEQKEFEDDANAVLGASDDSNCTYSKGYVKRQAIYACLTCSHGAKYDSSKLAGFCLACSLNCHEHHELVELYTKRNFRCDCGNPKFNHPCQFTPNKSDLNYENKYNQNFAGIYCNCHRQYPDPECLEEEEMIQCIICEDWLHEKHLDATVPYNDQYAEMVCQACMADNDFLHDYSHLIINTVDKEVIVTDPDLDVDITSITSKPSSNGDLEQSVNGISDDKSDKTEGPDTEKPETTGDIETEATADTSITETKSDGDENMTSNENEAVTSQNAEIKQQDAEQSKDIDEKAPAETESTGDKADVNTELNKDDQTEPEKKTNIDPDTNEEKHGDDVTKTEDAAKKEDLATESTEKPDPEALEKTEDPETKVNCNVDGNNSEVNINEQKSDVSTTDDDKSASTTEVAPENKTQEEITDKIETTVASNSEDKETAEKLVNEEIKDENSKEETSDKNSEENEHKRKLSTEDKQDQIAKKPKLDEKKCVRPRGVKRVYTGATFWPSTLRQKLCTCNECISMYKDLAVLFLIDVDDTVTAYEALGKERTNGGPSQYEKGLQALSSLDRSHQINALTEYNKMRDKLLDYLKSFKDRREIVKEEDIKAFFAGMKPKREPDGVYFCR